MIYTGSDTDLDYGQKYADKYEFITNNSLDTLKRFGNLLVSAERFMAVFQRIAKEKFDTSFKAPFKFDEHTSKLYNDCLGELTIELSKLTGFQAFTFRVLEAKTIEEKDCIIIERSTNEPEFVLISDWEELSKVEPSETHKLEIDVEGCNGYIIALNREFDYDHCHYLSTHTFYGKNHEESTKLLRSCGFNVTLKNWG